MQIADGTLTPQRSRYRIAATEIGPVLHTEAGECIHAERQRHRALTIGVSIRTEAVKKTIVGEPDPTHCRYKR
jgi:hypothetical protein